MSTQQQAPGFAHDVRPLFRAKDVQSMASRFDLSSYEDVKANADAIHAAVAKGTMPCDGPWTADQVGVFSTWMDAGYPE